VPHCNNPHPLARTKRAAGARFVTAIETEKNRRWAEARISALTGGEEISARYMRGDFFDFKPSFKLFFAGNHKPRLHTVNEAMRRRLHMIPFSVTIPRAERDPDLPEKLRDEWPGILGWAIEGGGRDLESVPRPADTWRVCARMGGGLRLSRRRESSKAAPSARGGKPLASTEGFSDGSEPGKDSPSRPCRASIGVLANRWRRK